jgi:hypothetical protein
VNGVLSRFSPLSSIVGWDPRGHLLTALLQRPSHPEIAVIDDQTKELQFALEFWSEIELARLSSV